MSLFFLSLTISHQVFMLTVQGTGTRGVMIGQGSILDGIDPETR